MSATHHQIETRQQENECIRRTMPSTTVNPHKRCTQLTFGRQEMGPQSQRHVSLEKRKCQLSGNGSRKKQAQATLFGGEAFHPDKHCVVCRGKKAGRKPHRSHHSLCWNNPRTKGVTSAAQLQEQDLGLAGLGYV